MCLQSLYKVQVECLVRKRALGSRIHFVIFSMHLLPEGMLPDEAAWKAVKVRREGVSYSSASLSKDYLSLQ